MNNVISDLQHLALLEGDLLVARANVRQGIGTERLSPTELTDAEKDIFSAILQAPLRPFQWALCRYPVYRTRGNDR